MKGVWILFAVCVAAVVTAGCIAEPETTEDPVVGTWVAYDYTTATGVHYMNINDTYYANFTGIEEVTLDNGKILRWDFIWMKDGSEYVTYYQPFTMWIYPNGATAKLNSGAEISDWIMKRTDGTGIFGDWHLVDKGFGEGNLTGNASISIYENGTSLMVSTLKSPDPYINTMEWTELGEGLIVHTMSKPVHLYILDGVLYDNFGSEARKI